MSIAVVRTRLVRPASWHDADGTGYQVVEVDDGAYTWQWLENGDVASSTDETWPTISEALRAAAVEAEGTFTDPEVARDVARALRISARVHDTLYENAADRLVGRAYPLYLDNPGAGRYQIERLADGTYRHVWFERDETPDWSGDSYPTIVEAILAAADDAEDAIGDAEGGKKLARRLRASAAAMTRHAEAQAPGA